jgi:cation-transporting ATPase 13A3/4/5
VNRSQLKNVINTKLVPGDLIRIERNMMMPCDCILIKGDVMVNEASLTGESIPIPKIPL